MMIRRRNIELSLLVTAALPVGILFLLVGAQAHGDFSTTYLTVPASLFALFMLAHMAIRRLAPNADPVMLPLAFVLSGIGIAFITRLVPDKAMSQIMWLFIGVATMIFVLAIVPSLERLANYKYILMVTGLILMVLPAFVGREINGSKLWIVIGGFSIQPGEIARIFIILFLAAYLAENREMLSISTRKFLGIPMPEMRTLAPLLLMWAVSFLVLVAEKDLGASLLFFCIFLVILYAATGRWSYVVIGLLLFAVGATAAYFMFTHVQTRVSIWMHPFADATGKGYQLVQSMFAFADGGFLGRGVGAGIPTRIPEVDTDFIFAAIGEELGLLGAVSLVICFLVLVFRGLSVSSRAKSDMAAFTGIGLSASLAVQVFVIVGGVTGLIPLTGITVPFVSRGGSSMVATFVLLALLLRVGDESTGVESEIASTGKGLAAIGRVALANRIRAFAIFFSILAVALVGQLTWLQVINARSLQNSTYNTRGLMKERYTWRGSIITADGVTLAQSSPEPDGTYSRTYPQRAMAAHTIGYYSEKFGRSGIEAVANDALTGKRTYSSLEDVLAAATNQPVQGDNVMLTLDSRVQQAAQEALNGGTGKGAIVVLNPKTGAVLASASNPTYDPETLDKSWQDLNADANAPLLDRARQTLLAPGSTFKVVTLAGAYANGTATPQSTYSAPGTMKIGNAPVTNFESSSYSQVSLEVATAKSINTVFGQVAVQLGAGKLVKQAEDFGFNTKIPFELPIKNSLMPLPSEMTEWETAWAGIGQPVGEHESAPGPQSTVFEMALVAAGIANEGVIMQPYVIDSVQPVQGPTTFIATTKSREWRKACEPEVANQVTEAMKLVVNSGSGRGGAIKGVQVAGKTGTAEVGASKPTNAWFIAFAPADDPVVALAILLEGGGQGGRAAAPAARRVLEAALAAAAK